MEIAVIILGAIGIIAGIVGLVMVDNKKIGAIIGALGLVLLIFGASFTIIPTGHTGVRTTFGQISQDTVPTGFNWKTPFIQSIKTVDNRKQDVLLATDRQIWGESIDRVELYMAQVTVTYQINPDQGAWIYSNVTDGPKGLISYDLVASALKNASKELATADATNRALIEPLARVKVQEALDNKFGTDIVTINAVVIGDMNYEQTYITAIAEKNTTMQRQEQQAIENRIAIEKATADAEAKRIAAEGEANAEIARAQGTAEANRVVNESITDKILDQNYIDAISNWRPQVIGESAVPFYQVETPAEAG